MTGIVYAFAAYGLVCALCAVIAVAVIARAVRAGKRTPRDWDAELRKLTRDGDGRG